MPVFEETVNLKVLSMRKEVGQKWHQRIGLVFSYNFADF